MASSEVIIRFSIALIVVSHSVFVSSTFSGYWSIYLWLHTVTVFLIRASRHLNLVYNVVFGLSALFYFSLFLMNQHSSWCGSWFTSIKVFTIYPGLLLRYLCYFILDVLFFFLFGTWISHNFKGGITHTVSPSLMLILCTYRVVLHPSYLQRAFSFIGLIKEWYSFMILPKKSRVPGGVPWAKLNIDKHLHADCQLNTDIWCRFTSCLLFWIMTGIFYSWDRSICQYLMMCKSSVKLGLVSKTFINKHTANSVAAPEKQNASTVYVVLASDVTSRPLELCLKVWCIWHTKVETLQ